MIKNLAPTSNEDIGASSTKERFLFYLRKAAPYLILLAASLMPFWFWLIYPFFTGGDDGAVQISILYDLYYGFQNGFFDSTNHVYMGIYAMNANLFYGLLPHYCMVITTYLFSFMGATLHDGMVFISVLSVFISGIFAYYLVEKITGRKSFGIAGGIAYIFMPYRLFCFFYRFAISEAVAMCFLPIFFYALYRIIHDKEIVIPPYIMLVLSLAGIILSHPFTAIITLIGGVIYLLCNIPNLIRTKRFKKGRFYAYFAGSIVLEIGLVFAFCFPMIEALASGAYRVSVPEVMWTSLEDVISRISQSIQFAGFINFSWRDNYLPTGAGDTLFQWAFGLALFPFLCFLSLFLDLLIKKKAQLPYWQLTFTRILVLAVLLIGVPLCFSPRIELLMAFLLYFSIYVIWFIFLSKEKDALLYQNDVIREEFSALWKEGDLYASLIIMVFCLFAIFSPVFWEYAPSILRMCQFPFRFWGLFGFFALIFVAYLCRPLRKISFGAAPLIALACYFLVLQQGGIDKRIYCIEKGNGRIGEPTLDYVLDQDHYGHQNEYFPQIIYEIVYGNEESTYANSLVYSVGRDIVYQRDVPFGIEEYPSPAFLEGKGEGEITYLKTPEVTFHFVLEEDSLVQLPQIYYDGYEAVWEENGKETHLEVENVDGFIAISIPKGEGELKITYPGPLLRQIGRPISWTCFALTWVILGYGLYDEHKKTHAIAQ